MNAKSILVLSVGVMLTPPLVAEPASEGHWTQIGGGYWWDPANWQDGAIPGVYKTNDGEGGIITVGEPGGTAYFDHDIWSWRAVQAGTFDVGQSNYALVSISNLVFEGEAFATMGANAYFPFYLEQGGGVYVRESCTKPPLFKSAIGFASIVDTRPITIQNDSSETFRIDPSFSLKQAASAWVVPPIRYGGKGTISLGGRQPGYNNCRFKTDLFFTTPGKLLLTGTFENTTGLRTETGSGPQTVEIAEGAFCKIDVGGLYDEDAVLARTDLTFTGAGTLVQKAYGSTTLDMRLKVFPGCTLVVDCGFATEIAGAGWVLDGEAGGVMKVTGENRFTGPATIRDGAVFEAQALGAVGETSPLGLGSQIVLSGDGVLKYVGAGETTDRAVTLGGSGILAQCGTGPVVFAGAATSTSSSGTLVLSNDTEVAAEYAGAISNGTQPLAIRKVGAGEWTLSGVNTTTGATTVDGGTLTLAPSGELASSVVTANAGTTFAVAGDGTVRAKSLAGLVAADGVVTVGPGVTLTVGSLTRSGSKAIDIRPDDGAAVKVTGLSGLAPDWVTVNGKSAKVDLDGNLVARGTPDAQIPARGGVIPNVVGAEVAITTPGADGAGPITLAESSATILSLTQRTTAEAVVGLAADETLSVESLTVETNAAPLTIGAVSGRGTLTAGGTSLRVDTQGEDSLLTVRSGFGLPAAGTVEKRGAGTLLFDDNFAWSGTLQLLDGIFAVSNAAAPLAATLTGTGTFLKADDANWTLSKAQTSFTGTYALGGGRTTYTNPNQFGADSFDTTIQVKSNATLDVTGSLSRRKLKIEGSGVRLLPTAHIYSGACGGLELTGDTTLGGADASPNYSFSFYHGRQYPNVWNMNGHSLTKTGYGNLTVGEGYVTNAGPIRIVGPCIFTTMFGFDLGGFDAPALTTVNDVSFSAERMPAQRRPLVIESGTLTMYTSNYENGSPETNAWKGPVTMGEGTTFSLETKHDTTMNALFTLGGELSGAGSLSVTARTRGIVAITNADNSAWTGNLSFNGGEGGIRAEWPGSIPGPSKVLLNYGRLVTPLPNWSRAEILAMANGATLQNNATVSVDTTLAEDGADFALSSADVTSDAFGLGHEGTNAMNLIVSDAVAKPVALSSHNGTLRVTGAGALTLRETAATSDLHLGWGKLAFDGLEGGVTLASGALRVGGSARSNIVGNRGEVEIRNTTVSSTGGSGIVVGGWGPGLLHIGTDAAVTSPLTVANGNWGRREGAVWQEGGEMNVTGSYCFLGTSGLACYRLSGGTLTTDSGSYSMGYSGRAVFAQYGGRADISKDGGNYVYLGYGGSCCVYVRSGTFTAPARVYQQSGASELSSYMTVDGSDAAVTFGDTLYLANGSRKSSTEPIKAIVNLNGGTLTAAGIGRYPTSISDGAKAYVNFNGGTLVSTATVPLGTGYGYPTVPNRVTVGAGGATVVCDAKDGNIPVSLSAPTGNGVTAIAVPASLVGETFVAAPYVEIFDVGGTGDGASAYVELDPATRRISRVLVTSSGWDYTDAKAVFYGGEESALCTNDCVMGAIAGGGFTKEGSKCLILTATNTYAGATVVKAGTLKLGLAEALPSNTAVRVEGGTLDLNGFEVPLSRVSVAGGGRIANGSVTLPGITYDVADPQPVTCDCAVAFAPGAKVVLQNVDRLDPDVKSYVIARFTGEVTNMPTEVEGLTEEAAKDWHVSIGTHTIRLSRNYGLMLMVR